MRVRNVLVEGQGRGQGLSIGTRRGHRAGGACFEVDRRDNKIQVRKAVEELFDVKVEGVHIVNRKGKPIMRYGRVMSHRSASRKAYVTLAEGSKTLEFFEGI